MTPLHKPDPKSRTERHETLLSAVRRQVGFHLVIRVSRVRISHRLLSTAHKAKSARDVAFFVGSDNSHTLPFVINPDQPSGCSSHQGRSEEKTSTLPHLEAWGKDYNSTSSHSSLGGLAPDGFAGSKAGLQLALAQAMGEGRSPVVRPAPLPNCCMTTPASHMGRLRPRSPS